MDTHPASRPQLRPRDLITTLFAAALDGDAGADADLLALAVVDARAQAAHEAIVVAEMQARFCRPDPASKFQNLAAEGHERPSVDPRNR